MYMFSTLSSRQMGLICPFQPSLLSRRISQPHTRSLIPSAKQQNAVSEADLYVGIDPISNSNAADSGTPWYITVPAGFVAVLAVFRTIGALSRRRKSSLQDRGFKPAGAASEDSYSRAIRGMKTVQFEELSDEQVMAARQRRRQEIARDGGPIDLDKIELPENHPFAVKEEVSPEEEEMQRLRLSARRGLSPEDMRLLKQQQALAAQLEAEQDERQRTQAQNSQ